MLAVVITCVVFLPIARLSFYAMHHSKQGKVKLNASVLKVVSFSIEVEADNHCGEPPPGSGDNTADGGSAPRVA